METRANYIVVGAFTVAGFFALLLFLGWFARVELDRQYSYYDIDFSSVSGLSNASEVRFSGLLVGKVVDVGLSPEVTGMIRVRVEVAAETPVRVSTIATIESLGVTGVSYVSLTSGDPRDPLLAATPDRNVPMIRSGRSALQTLSEDAPSIVEEVLAVTRQLGELLGPENQERVSTVLQNLERSTGDLGQALTDFSSVADTINQSSDQILSFTSRLEEISASAVKTLATADTTLSTVTETARRAEETMERGDGVLDSGKAALESADAFITGDLTRLVAELDEATATIRSRVDQLGSDATAAMEDLRQTGAMFGKLIADARETLGVTGTALANITDAAEAVEGAATGVDTFIATSGTELANDARALIAEANRVVASVADVAETDLPAIFADIRGATETAAGVVDRVGADLSAAAERADDISAEVGATLETVSGTFSNADATLERLNTALETGDAALSAADRAFASADTLIQADLGPLVRSLQETLDQIDGTIAQVSQDIPAITQALRQTAEDASAAFGEVERTASGVGPPLRAFGTEGLPQYTRLAREARALAANMDRLVTRIERDPAQYFLGRDVPVFQR